MPVLDSSDFVPDFLFKNNHFSTILPHLYTATRLSGFVRKRMETPDDDFLDLDILQKGYEKLVILCHGLEGSSSSHYINLAARYFSDAGFDVLAWNYRSCSGEMNRQLRMYHSGATDDLGLVVNSVKSNYRELVIAGFSLGGNLALKYGAEINAEEHSKIKGIVAISAPCHLSSCSNHFAERGNWLYEKRFLIKLCRKIRLKYNQFPNEINLENLKFVHSLKDFDQYFTAPIHGFKDAEDYYTRASSIFVLEDIKIPSLIINAKNDSFLHRDCFPYEMAGKSSLIHLHTPDYGGHVGFGRLAFKKNWAMAKAIDFSNIYTN